LTLRLALAAACLLASAPARAQQVQLYSLSDKGHVTVGGTALETLPGGFDPTDFDMPKGTERWTRMAVEGADRYVVRIDGLVERNGVALDQLPLELANVTPIWREISVLDGTVAVVRTDGLLYVDGVQVADHEVLDNSQIFTDIELLDTGGPAPTVFCLRNDGAVFRDDELLPLYQLQEPDSTFGFAEGQSADTQWQALTPWPGTGLLLALRADGRLRSLDPAGPPPPPPGDDEGDPEDELPPEAGEPVASFPFVAQKKKAFFGQRFLFRDVECTDSGLARVLRFDGRVYGSEDPEAILVDLPGKGNKPGRRYLDLLVLGEEHYVLRRDGKVYAGASDKPLLEVQNRGVQLAGSAVVPDLAGAEPHGPELGRVVARVVEGQSLELPVVARDVDTPVDELFVSVDLSELPGASFDADAHVVSWPAAGPPGKRKVRVTVDDGLSVVQRTQRVQVVPSHDPPGNKKPLRAKFKPVPALVGVDVALPVPVADRDGDELLVELVGGDVLDGGGTYDPDDGRLHWTPGLGDVGKALAKLTVSDGSKTRKLQLRFLVQAALIDVEAGP